ncbi:claudin-4-like [Salvelinus sp. IW2-2015]|uniref:claudin-4-like n=1 Tax=Salvelinus sp. IW2-2015 TaxID=2691554 RepID=UPI0038D3F4AE
MGMDIMDIGLTEEMVEVVGIALGVIGLILTIVICALPTWIETTFIAENAANTEVVWYGLWMSCVTQGTGKTQCEKYNSMGYWPHFLQPARAMIPTATTLVVLGVTVSMVGTKCTNCIKDETSQAKLIIIAGILFILAGILILIPLSMVTRFVQIHYSMQFKGKTELYFGWVAASLLLIGGFILCINVGVFGWMMVIFGWIVSLVSCYVSILTHTLLPFSYSPEPHYGAKWTGLITLTSISTILGALGVMGSIFGTRCCNCIKNNRTRVKARFIVGTFFILTGILVYPSLSARRQFLFIPWTCLSTPINTPPLPAPPPGTIYLHVLIY